MRVLVLAEAIDDLSAGVVGTAVARGWAERGHQVALVPLAVAGAGVAQAVADLLGEGAGIAVVGDPGSDGGSSYGLGLACASALHERPDQLWVDLATSNAADAGQGLLRGLAGVSPSHPIDAEVVSAARARLGNGRVVGIASEAETAAELTGFRGLASLAAAAARDEGRVAARIQDLLDQDAGYAEVATSMGVTAPPRGAGAHRGLGLAIIALGGVVASAPGALGGLARLGTTVERADLVVAVVDALDFGDAGGEVMTAARSWAEAASLPCVALAGTVRISARELRTLGVEAAYGLEADEPVNERALYELAAKVARTWTWPTSAGISGAAPELTPS